MYGFFKFVLYLGVVAGLLGLAYPYVEQDLPAWTPKALSFGGLALIIVGLLGRSATKPTDNVEWR